MVMSIKANLNRQLYLGLIGLGLVLAMEAFTDADCRLQRLFFDFQHSSWPITPQDHQRWRLFLYDGPKWLVGAVGAGSLIYLIVLGAKRRPLARKALILCLSLVFVPLLAAGGKRITNIHCPKDLRLFNGFAPYRRALFRSEANGPALPKGKCFPAGHASGGFALMALFFCFEKPRRRRGGLAAGLTAGWAMGLYQMLRGEHFISHTLASMFASWLVIAAIAKLVGQIGAAPGAR